MLHHSDDPEKRSADVTCYLDDSGIEPDQKVAVIGGLVMRWEDFFRLDAQWKRVLKRYSLESIHMVDFVRPNGKHCGMFPEIKKALFRELAEIIASRRDWGISVSVTHTEFVTAFSVPKVREVMDPYALAFIGAALINTRVAEATSHPDKIAYLIDSGNPHADKVRTGHSLILVMERFNKARYRTGAIAFDSDKNNSALQAADVIAWATRRRLATDGLLHEYEPLRRIFEERYNVEGKRIHPHFHRHQEHEQMCRMMDLVREEEGRRVLNDEVRMMIDSAWMEE